MRKRDELEKGCMAKARDDEMTFVLLGRDPAAIRAWIRERIEIGKNNPDDPKLIEAEQCAATMEREYPGKPSTRACDLTDLDMSVPSIHRLHVPGGYQIVQPTTDGRYAVVRVTDTTVVLRVFTDLGGAKRWNYLSVWNS